MLKTIRTSRAIGSLNLIEQTKVRDRTAPLKGGNFESHRVEKFSFSEAGSSAEEVVRGRSSRVLLSEMSS